VTVPARLTTARRSAGSSHLHGGPGSARKNQRAPLCNRATRCAVAAARRPRGHETAPRRASSTVARAVLGLLQRVPATGDEATRAARRRGESHFHHKSTL